MKKIIFISLVTLLLVNTTNAQNQIWRVNNQANTSPNFTNLSDAITNIAVIDGDTIHIEPSATAYSAGISLTKRLIFIGNGYSLTGVTGNSGLQENGLESRVSPIGVATGSAGTKFLGLTFESNAINFLGGYTGNVNLTLEKCKILGGDIFGFAANQTYSNMTVRKCLFGSINMQVANLTLNNFVFENCIAEGSLFYFVPAFASNFVIRNNTFKSDGFNPPISFTNAYVANNIFLTGGFQCNFGSCNVKNNLFTGNQAGVTVGPLSTNGNNLINQSLASIILNTGSIDGKFQLAASSPAINGGVDILGNKPNCGAFGGNDPYKLSGIPGIPTIYSLTVPANIPVGSPTMNVTFSTRNNN